MRRIARGWRGLLVGAVAALFLAVLPGPALAVGDLIPPVSSATPPQYATSTTFDVPYTASDDGGSGLAHVDLYARAPGELVYSLVATDDTPDTPVFSYSATAGDGAYSFYTVAYDGDGNAELPPLAGDDGTTTLDTTPPQSTATATPPTGSGPITVAYTAADSGSGVASVELWVLPPGAAAYSLAATDTTPDSPSFDYQPAGAGDYSFYTQAVDAAGNREGAPAAPEATVTVPPPDPAPPPDPTPPPAQPAPPASSPASPPPPPAAAPIAELPAAPAPTPAPADPQRGFVAAIFLPKQKLGTVLRSGLALKLYAYRGVTLRVALGVSRAVARRFGLRDARLTSKVFNLENPGVYLIRVRVPSAAARRLRAAAKLSFALKSVLTAAGGTSATTSLVTLKKR